MKSCLRDYVSKLFKRRRYDTFINNTKFMLALKYGSQIGEDTRESKPFPERGEVVKTWTIEVKFCPEFA